QDAIPGSVNGNEFNEQFSRAVQKIYDSGHSKPVAFSHAESIMYWTLMNVKNPKESLVKTHPLPNMGRVVITGSPTMGWTLVDRRWPSKADLVLAAFIEGIRQFAVPPETGTLRGDLMRLGETICQQGEQHAGTIRAVLVEVSRSPALNDVMQQQFIEPRKALI